jgi:hypothetical protein
VRGRRGSGVSGREEEERINIILEKHGEYQKKKISSSLLAIGK